ncbi:MAG: hypothetical protein ABW194_06755 [Novosphingobium sp.]
MKEFSALVVVRTPPERLFATMRDRLPELVATLSDIEKVDPLERRDEDDALLVVNRWHARQTIPKLLQQRLGRSRIDWLDTARWIEPRQVCTWEIAPSLGDGALTCAGETTFEPAMGGRGTRARFAGRLDIAPDYLAGVAGSFHGPVRALVETIATTLIPANFRAMAEQAAKLA